MGKAAGATALPVVGMAAGAAFGGAPGAMAGGAIGGTIASTVTSTEANKDALKQQKQALQEQLRQSRETSALEDRQLVDSLKLADSQAIQRLSEQERQAAVAAGEDVAQVQSNLETEHVNAAQRATDIRRQLMATLGEQNATMASRNTLLGQTGASLAKEARRISGEDARTNDLNYAQSEADAAAERRKIGTSLENTVRSNALGLGQQRETAAKSVLNTREATAMDLANQKRAGDMGYSAAKTQAGYANTAALISGFSNLSGIAYDYYSTSKAIEPTARAPVSAYKAPTRLTPGAPGQASRNGF